MVGLVLGCISRVDGLEEVILLVVGNICRRGDIVLLQHRVKVLLVGLAAVFLEDRPTLDVDAIRDLLLHDLLEDLPCALPIGILDVLYESCK